ncbi:hypothetical protein BJ875DRAFT_465936 [Amylocarpus encephaloides]|uniref:Uncharacterized protein n=1 Tax=Amylocarpus encephaloides TaxID=45428 RepID=A0A9P7YFI0_9HELO|nr:hypothetical protein BJ875DRAFT_465936 [Amylocarpus encephaloides]
MMHNYFAAVFPAIVAAVPFIEESNVYHMLAEPFEDLSTIPGIAQQLGWSLFRRQGCPILTLLCPGGNCCSYGDSCCGRNCCASGYLCTGGTLSNPCCVAIGASSNDCGAPNSNPCTTPGYLPCSGSIGFCCPPDSNCYFDTLNYPRCAPKSGPLPSPSPTPPEPSPPSPTPPEPSPPSPTPPEPSPPSPTPPEPSPPSPTPPPPRPAVDSTTPIPRPTPKPVIFVPSQSGYIPWAWYVTTSDSTSSCPSVARSLGTFAAVNGVVAILSAILCHRKVVQVWSFKKCGNPESKMWYWGWIIPLTLQLGSNVVIATIYKTTPGYETGFSIADLFLFWTTRPRLSWLILGLLIGIGAEVDVNGYWESAAKSSLIAEVILLVISCYYMGITANFARANGYYNPTADIPSGARLMYVGALLSLIFVFGAIVNLVMIIGKKHDWTDFLDDKEWLKLFLGMALVSSTTWLAAWLFWAGYVTTAQESYCPPKLATSGAIWGLFSLLGNVLGGGGA